MSKQPVITGFTIPKQPDTPKRKRGTKQPSTFKDPPEVKSPSQASPEQKRLLKDTGKQKRHEDIIQKEEIKAKTRGRVETITDKAAEDLSTLETIKVADIPLPPSPPDKIMGSESQDSKCPSQRIRLSSNQHDLKPMEIDSARTKELQRSKSGHKNCTKEANKIQDQESDNPKELEVHDTRKEGAISRESVKRNDRATNNPMGQLNFRAALTSNNSPILPQYKAHRIHVSFAIKTPKNKAKRTEYLARGLNKFLVAAKKVAPNERTIYVRRYKDHASMADTEKPQWIDSFGTSNMMHLMNFTHGFYAFQALRNGTFRLSLQIVVPITTEIASFIENVNGIWGDSSSQMVRDSKEQKLYDPKQIGWLLRSTWNMVATPELQDDLDRLIAAEGNPEVSFGLQWKTIPSPGNKKETYNKDTAIRAVVVSTNADHMNLAWRYLFKAYNSDEPSPLGVDMHFVPTKDHPDIRNNQTAIHNITYLMESQRIFGNDTNTEECYALADPDKEVESGMSLRVKLLGVTSRVMGEKKKGARLFHSITARLRDGVKSYFFTYHMALGKEATSIMAGLPSFLQTELNLDPAIYCYPTHINTDHEWIPDTRTIRNSTVDFLSSLVDTSLIPEDDQDGENESYEMDSQGHREFLRIVGLDDGETVADLGASKPTRTKTVPTQVGSTHSVQSEMSGLTNYSSASKASQHRKELRQTIDDQRLFMDEQEEAMKQMQANLLTMMQALQTGEIPPSFKDMQMPHIPDFPLKNLDGTKEQSMQVEEDHNDNEPEDAPNHDNVDEDVTSTKFAANPQNVLHDITDLPPHMDSVSNGDNSATEAPMGNTFVDSDGILWETGSQLSVDNPEGHKREIDETWFEVTQGPETAARAYAMKMIREGQEVVLSRTGSMDPDKYVVYVVVHNIDVQPLQDSGQSSDPTENRHKVGFNSTTELQEYDPDTTGIEGEQDVVETKRGATSPPHNPKKESDRETAQEEDNDKTDSEEDEDSSESTDTSQSSAQSSSELSSSSTNTKQSKVHSSKQTKGAPNFPVSKGTDTTSGRKSNITRDIVAATAKMKTQQTYRKSTPRGTLKSASGDSPGQNG